MLVLTEKALQEALEGDTCKLALELIDTVNVMAKRIKRLEQQKKVLVDTIKHFGGGSMSKIMDWIMSQPIEKQMEILKEDYEPDYEDEETEDEDDEQN